MFVIVAFINSYHFEEEQDFVILFDKVGQHAVMTTFRVDPEKYDKEEEDPNYCQVGGDKLYTPHNVSIFTAASKGDVLRRYHYTSYYQIWDKRFFQDCFEVFMPVEIVSLWPDKGKWPFRKGDLAKNDPDYARIAELIRSPWADN